MFLLRCLFWLGLVFSQIAQHEGMDASALSGETVGLGGIAGGHAASLGAMAAGVVEQHCRDNPAACLALAAQAANVSNGARTGVVAPSRDSLSASDRAPAWRGARPADKRG